MEGLRDGLAEYDLVRRVGIRVAAAHDAGDVDVSAPPTVDVRGHDDVLVPPEHEPQPGQL